MELTQQQSLWLQQRRNFEELPVNEALLSLQERCPFDLDELMTLDEFVCELFGHIDLPDRFGLVADYRHFLMTPIRPILFAPDSKCRIFQDSRLVLVQERCILVECLPGIWLPPSPDVNLINLRDLAMQSFHKEKELKFIK